MTRDLRMSMGSGSGEDIAEVLAAARAALTEQDARLAERDACLAERDACLAERDARLSELNAQLSERNAAYEALRERYLNAKQELLLLKNRLYVATAERIDTAQLKLEFEGLSKELDVLAGIVGENEAGSKEEEEEEEDDDDPKDKPKGKRGPNGRRNLAEADLPETLIALTDPVMEALVEEGKAKKITPKTSYKLARRPAQYYRVKIERAVYRIEQEGSEGSEGSETSLKVAAKPPELLSRCLAAPSLLADISASKFHDGLPLYRQEHNRAFEGASVDRGTMSRWLEELGGSFGATVVAAMERDAKANAFCIATDATGFAVQPGPREKGTPRRACRKGHYFVRIADRDHILFDYTKTHTSKVARAMFKGFSGYIQADACSIYDALFRPAKGGDPDDDGCTRSEVGCWSHCRRKFWEAAFAKVSLAREALVRQCKIFEVDAKVCRKGKPPPSEIKRRRKKHLEPLLDEFFEFVEVEYERIKNTRGPLNRALGYAVRQKDALRRVLEDGRLRLDNNPSESELRKVVRIRDASLFAGSDEHAESAGALLSLIASAKLHRLDPRRYLRDLIRVLPFWPKTRFLELAPKYWSRCRTGFDLVQLDAEVGWLDVPAPLDLDAINAELAANTAQ